MRNLKKTFNYKDLLSYIKKNYFTYSIIVISIISIILLILTSPVLSILWLCICTLYLIYNRSYKDISKVWGITIGIWYLIFSTSLCEITIFIGFENTKTIIHYLLNNKFLFENLCFQTVYLLDMLAAKLGFSIYIPAVVNMFSFLLNFLKKILLDVLVKEIPVGKIKSILGFLLVNPKKSRLKRHE